MSVFAQDPRLGGSYALPFTVTARNASAEQTLQMSVTRMIRVNTTADAGAGSFRNALLEANAHCTDGIECEIGFDLPEGATFEPLTPLPAITACGSIFINGGKYDYRQGDRLYELTGARLTGRGNGLDYRPTCYEQSSLNVHGLAINRFPDDGITTSANNRMEAYVMIHGVFIGTDRTGREARPNGLRGITAYSPSVGLFVASSILSGNGRSGVFLWDVKRASFIDNRIGLSVDRQPLSNGAAGMFLRAGSLSLGDNVIAHNHDFGLALTLGADVKMYPGNSIFANEFVGIDWGLDGPTRVGGEERGIPNAPRITSAVYDPTTNFTIVRGIVQIDRPMGTDYFVTLFSNTTSNARGEWEGEIQHDARSESFYPRGRTGTFEWEIRQPGDLRGRFLTTTTNLVSLPGDLHPINSEFSEAFGVR